MQLWMVEGLHSQYRMRLAWVLPDYLDYQDVLLPHVSPSWLGWRGQQGCKGCHGRITAWQCTVYSERVE